MGRSVRKEREDSNLCTGHRTPEDKILLAARSTRFICLFARASFIFGPTSCRKTDRMIAHANLTARTTVLSRRQAVTVASIFATTLCNRSRVQLVQRRVAYACMESLFATDDTSVRDRAEQKHKTHADD